MKCPTCGFTNNRPGARCKKCGASMTEQPLLSTTQEAPPPSRQSPVPEWRKEVTRKAREFDERKKFLTTPPRPLKKQTAEHPTEDFAPESERFPESEPNEPVFSQTEPPITHRKEQLTPNVPTPRAPEPAVPIMMQQPSSQHRFELDLQPPIGLEEENEFETSLHLGRRAASLLVDHAILGVVVYVVAFLCREVLSYDLQSLLKSAPLPLISAFFLFHFLYFFYFLKTARQTPGQVFFSLEVRDPLIGGIGAGKIFSRWAALVFLNVLNILPLVFGKRFLLLDRLSGTEVRSMKPED